LYTTVSADTSPAAKFKTCSDAPKDICGPNARCSDILNSARYSIYGEPFCTCLPGSTGIPPNCKSICPTECKSGEFCDVKTKTCKAGCVRNVNCNADEYCDQNNKCKKGCRSSPGCKDDEYCDPKTRECKKGCRLQINSCKPKEYCDRTRTCRPGCNTHADCASDEVCRSDYKCTKGCIRSTCGDNSDCSVVDNKYYCTCKDGFFPEKDTGCRPKKTTDVIPKDEKDLDCKKYCSEHGLCSLNKNNISCYCPKVSWGNPFNDCKPKTPQAPPKSPNEITLSALTAAPKSA
jgi:hypothetical protein